MCFLCDPIRLFIVPFLCMKDNGKRKNSEIKSVFWRREKKIVAKP